MCVVTADSGSRAKRQDADGQAITAMRKLTTICAALALGGIPLMGVIGCGSSTPQRTASTQATTPTTETSLPPLDANGYIEGPTEYTDHGMRIRLNAEQASSPIKESEGSLYLNVRPIKYVQRPEAQSAQETREIPDSEFREEHDSVVTVHLGKSSFIGGTKSGVMSCVSQTIAKSAAGVRAQTCTLEEGSGPGISAVEVLDENAKLLANQFEGSPATVYEEMVGLFPNLADEQQGATQSESTPTTSTESTESTPTTSTPETTTERPSSSSSSSSSRETSCGEVSREVTHVRAVGVSCATARSLAREVSQSGAANKPPTVPEGCLPNNQTTSTGSCVVEGYHCRSESVHAEASEAVCTQGIASVKFRNGPPGE